MDTNMLKVATQAALAAGEIVERYFGHSMQIAAKNKAKSDFVTSADTEAEGAIRQMILAHFPDHGFWGEEGGQKNIEKDYIWVVDPLDSTSNFTFTIPLYSISIGLMHQGEMILGVIYIPKTRELFSAEKGKGAFRNDRKISLTEKITLAEAICAVQYRSIAGDEVRDRGLDDFVYFAKRTKKIRYLSSTVFELCRVAAGDLDFAVTDGYFIDYAAAKLILKEAGAVFVQHDGSPVENYMDGRLVRMVASNPSLADEVLKKTKGQI